MKKSEAIKLIAKYLAGKPIYNIYPHELLELIEQMGMMPPFTGKFRQENIIDRWGRDTGKTEWVRVIVSEWDNE